MSLSMCICDHPSDMHVNINNDIGIIECKLCDCFYFEKKVTEFWLKERAIFYEAAIYILLRDFFEDEEKIYIWLTTNNPLLGNVKPLDMIHNGRGKKLLLFIQNSIEASFP